MEDEATWVLCRCTHPQDSQLTDRYVWQVYLGCTWGVPQIMDFQKGATFAGAARNKRAARTGALCRFVVPAGNQVCSYAWLGSLEAADAAKQ